MVTPDSGLRRRAFVGGLAVTAAGAGAGWLALRDGGDDGGGQGAGASGTRRELTPKPAEWHISSPGRPRDIEGYADAASVRPGEEVRLHVSTTAGSFHVSAFRMGWYGPGRAGLVWRSKRVPGREQSPPRTAPSTRSAFADWRPSLTVSTEGWPEGAYLLRLESDRGHQRYVPLIVRSASAAGRTLLVHAVATWQAYNQWGGPNLYEGTDGSHESRSLKVSFDRPYDKNGAEKFLVYERAAVELAERLNIPLAWTTGLDLDRDPSVLRGARSVVVLGHDEYWTPAQRRHLTRARDAGSNLAVLGANTCFRRIRTEDGVTGPGRTVVCYKDDFRDDPVFPDSARAHEVTTDFRAGPGAEPESDLTGVLYEGYPVDAPYVVHRPDHWLFEGTGVRRGDRFDHLVGVEYDRVTPEGPTPRPIEVVAHSPVVCNRTRSHSDTAYYTAHGGAGVFAAGTMRWVEGLMAGSPEGGRNHGMDARTGKFVTRTTQNVLKAFAEGPAGRHRPRPDDNTEDLY